MLPQCGQNEGPLLCLPVKNSIISLFFIQMLSTGVLHKSKCIITNPKITPPLSTGHFVLLELELKVLCMIFQSDKVNLFTLDPNAQLSNERFFHWLSHMITMIPAHLRYISYC